MNKFKVYIPYNDTLVGYVKPGLYKHSEIDLGSAYRNTLVCIAPLPVTTSYSFSSTDYIDYIGAIAWKVPNEETFIPEKVYINQIEINQLKNYLGLFNFHKGVYDLFEKNKPYSNLLELNRKVELPYGVKWEYCFPKLDFGIKYYTGF
ncbi:MAG: hypothetical protein CV045_07385 [Cyanobacteria bacterium M5B4]|nr:MAG: hypothetical protein CV045_07385 [Cyanobacteria bacterium M5B4]